MSGTTPDLTESNIEKLKQLFPEIITDGKIDFEKLEILLGKEIDDTPERYNFTWHGKKETMQFAQQPSKGTLRPVKEKSKNWDTTGNIYIEGDNLEVLKLLQKSYNNKVKMIYIDPPYNTGNDFVYRDDFKDSVDSYLKMTGQKDNEGTKFNSNTESNGRYHTDWLNMMYSRLKLARNLLTESGLIFMSISDVEMSNLKKLSDEIFGEKNFLAMLSWKQGHTLNNSSPHFSNNVEYILVYIKNIQIINSSDNLTFLRYPKDKSKAYPFDDNDGKGKYKLDVLHARNYSKPYTHTFSNGTIWKAPNGRYPAFSISNLEKMESGNEIVFTGKEAKMKRYLNRVQQGISPASFLKEEIVGYSKDGTQDLRSLFPETKMFDQPKPVNLIKYLLSIDSQKELKEDKIILDFFSGSSTTAHAVMKLNAEDAGNRKFIMVQLPETLEEKSDAYKGGYRTICDIGEERIRRAGEKIKDELIMKNNKEGMLSEGQVSPDKLDIGFKMFSLDTSNLREWQSNFEDIELKIDLLESNFVDGRSEEDVLYEIILKNGLDLTYPINKIFNEGVNIYDVAFGNLFVCLSDKINRNVAHKIGALRAEYGIETSQVVFKDSGFENDTEKLNCYEILKAAGYQEADLLSI